MTFVRRRNYGVDKAIFGDPNNLTVANLTIDGTNIGQQTSGEREIKSGLFVSKVGSEIRYLPRTVVTTGATTSERAIVVTLPELFKVGDVLYPVEPYALVTLGGTIASTETLTITLAGISHVFTSAGTDLAVAATGLASLINAHPLTKQIARAVAVGSTIWIYALDGRSALSLAVAEGGSASTIAITTGGSALVVPNTAIGTIAAITMSTSTLTIAADAAIAVPVGQKIGVRVDEVYGLDISSHNFTDERVQNLAVYGAANAVRTQHLPYLDGELELRFPRMNFATRF
jgi:hypothetical protein